MQDRVLTPYEDEPLAVLLTRAVVAGEARQIITRLYHVQESQAQRIEDLEEENGFLINNVSDEDLKGW